jgi:predicted helicase
VVKKYLDAGIKAAHLDANTPDNLRKAIVKDFKRGVIKVVSNVGIMTEGFDFPGMQFVQLARPTKSLSMYLQMIGRVTRIMEGKNHGIVLDNAGLYIDHPQAFNMITGGAEINWQPYFDGWKQKRKEDKDLEKIEIIEYIAEDEQGRRFVGKQPEEVAGMKLIEVNSRIQERVLNITSLKEFDKLFAMFHRLPKVKKVGFTAFFKYLEYCEKNRILLGDAVWEYLHKQLVLDRREAIKGHQNYYKKIESSILEAPEKYPDGKQLLEGAKKNMDKQIERCNNYGVPESFLKKQRAEYKAKITAEQLKYGTN